MHARNRTWLLGSDPVERCRQRTMNIEGGDGSTLLLDFTGGVIDPRVTFTRSTNGTYINSQGYVTWSKSNLFLHGVDLSNASWTASNLTSRGSGISNPFGVAEATELFENTTNGTHGVRQTTTSNIGNQYYTFSVYMKAGVNRNIGCIYDTAVLGTDVVFYTLTGDGTVTIPAGSNSTMSGTITKITNNDPGDNWYRCTYTIYTTTGGAIHVGSANGTAFGNHSYGGTSGNSIVVWGGQFEMGTIANPFIPTTTAAKYDDPRFDHDPVTLAPRGLLVEATVINRLNWSEAFATSGGTNNFWNDTSISRTTGQTDPANRPTAIRFTASAGNATVISSAAIGSSAKRTFSIWLRRVTGTGDIQFTTDNGTTWTTQAITSSWVRYTFPATTEAQRVGIRIANNTNAIEMWGAQLEDGSGSSSYIPTASNTATRAADFAVLSDLSAIAFNTAGGSMVVRGFQTKLSAGSFPSLAAFLDASDVDVFGIRNSSAGLTMFGRFAGTSTSAEALRTITNNATYAFGMAADPTITTSAITVSVNGSSTTANKVGSATTISTPTKFAITRIGYGDYINCGTISSIKYWPTVKTVDELNSLTTG